MQRRPNANELQRRDTSLPALLMSDRRILTAIVLMAMCAVPAAVRAQGTPLSSILPELLGNTITLLPSNLPDQPNHVAHFQPEFDQIQVPLQVNQALLTMLSTYPLGSPSGGFTYTIDPALGTLTRSSDSFGPSFAERALTIGRGKLSLGFEHQHAVYDTLEGLNLRGGEVKFYIPHADCCSRGAAQAQTPDGSRLTPPFEGDLIEATLALKLASDTSVIFANYGISDRFDVGVAVPFVRVDVDASVLARIERLSTAQDPSVHGFRDPIPTSTPSRFQAMPPASVTSSCARSMRSTPRAKRRWVSGSKRGCLPATKSTCSARVVCRRRYSGSPR